MENSSYIGAYSIMLGSSDIKIDFYKVEPICDDKGHISGEEKELAHRITMPKDLMARLVESYQGLLNEPSEQVTNPSAKE